MSLTQTIPPTLEPVSLAQAKKHLRIDHDEEDLVLERQLAAARNWLERHTGLQIMRATFVLTLDRFPVGREIILPVRPVAAVTSIETDSGPLDPGAYHVDLAGRRIVARSGWPSVETRPGAVSITFEAGVATPADVPREVIVFLLLLAGQWYRYRDGAVDQSLSELPIGMKAILDSFVDEDHRAHAFRSGADADLTRAGF